MPKVRHLIQIAQFVIAVWVLAAVLIVLVATPLLSPPESESFHLLVLMGISGSISIVVAYAIYRSGIIKRLFSIRAAFLVVTSLTVGLVFLNIWFLAWEMFLEYHDLNLNVVLLLFAGGTAVGCAYFIGYAMTERIMALADGAEALSAGELSTRVKVDGNDELAALSASFNMMAARLQSAAIEHAMLEQSRRDLIAWASHDLRTPLASLRLVVDALADGVVNDEVTQQRYLQTAQREISNLNELINDLFDLSQLDTGHIELRREQTSLSDLLSDTLSTLRTLAERRGVRLHGYVNARIDPVEIDPEKIQRVLYNLITNAIRHTPSGGEVVLEADIVGDAVRVTVRDSGEGIQVQDLPHVFDRFYRGERARTRDQDGQRGAGLGLAIARGLIEAHRGTIAVESAPGQGAAFVFTLPRRAPA